MTQALYNYVCIKGSEKILREKNAPQIESVTNDICAILTQISAPVFWGKTCFYDTKLVNLFYEGNFSAIYLF